MRERGVLLGATGPAGNVLKIGPPLVFQREYAGLLLQTIDDVLGSTGH
jgi:4-aminobutyrate aminotransferase-like enzyme